MPFSWSQPLATGVIIVVDALQEVRNYADWLDSNPACISNLSGVLSGNLSANNGGYDVGPGYGGHYSEAFLRPEWLDKLPNIIAVSI